MKILFLSRWFPYPADNGARQRVWNLIKSLSTQHEVSLVSFTEQPPDCEAMRQWCVNVQTAPYRGFDGKSTNAILGFLSPIPRAYLDTHSVELFKLAEQEVQRFHPDVVIASQIDMAGYGARLAAPTRIFEEVEVSIIRDAARKTKDLPHKLRAGLTWAKTSRYIARLLRSYQGCTTASMTEQQHIKALTPANMPIEVIPNGVDARGYAHIAATPQPDTLVYNGAITYHANFDAVHYFLREIFPIIQMHCPAVTLYVTGKYDIDKVRQLPRNDAVIFTGYLHDVRPKVAQSWVTIAPLRVGGGTRLKILESLALGTPVVSTTKGAEGLSLEPDTDLLIADAPEQFAHAVLSVLTSPQKREMLSSNGRAAVAQYDWSLIGDRLNDFVDGVANGTWHKRD
jgi:glycosyltransferase involved in cell wall biosynthesis